MLSIPPTHFKAGDISNVLPGSLETEPDHQSKEVSVVNTAMIFNIQKFSLHDGPGIRTTVFFKGCPLHCVWCHNPESQQPHPEVFWNADLCRQCDECLRHCPQRAIQRTAVNTIITSPGCCTACAACTDSCTTNAREFSGRLYTIAELLREIEKDRPFYEQSGGGVTLSGGEALCQIDFAVELARICRQKGISVAIDTCGHVPFQYFERIIDYVDLFLYDIKLMDTAQHRQFTGQDNQLILENLQKLTARGARVNLRLPLIDGINTHPANTEALLTFIQQLPLSAVNLLPYHNTATDKYRRLNRTYAADTLRPPNEHTIGQIRALLEQAGFLVKIGG